MKKNLLVPLLIFALSACVQSLQPHNELIGVWKSDAEKTLQSMRSVEGIPEKSKQLLENNLFGHLVVEYREHEARSYFDADEHKATAMKAFYPYRLTEASKDAFVVHYYDETEGKYLTKTLRREGDCYFMPVTKWNFHEYFCRVK